jgi:hypothetical protein
MVGIFDCRDKMFFSPVSKVLFASPQNTLFDKFICCSETEKFWNAVPLDSIFIENYVMSVLVKGNTKRTVRVLKLRFL